MRIHKKNPAPETERPERWRDIPGLDGKYQASTEGRIRRLYKSKEPRVLKIITNRGSCKNQHVVNIYRSDGTRQQYTVLRLVAMAFYPGMTEGKNVVHRNGLHSDNTPQNALIIDQSITGKRCGSLGRRKGVCLVDGKGEIMEVYPSVTAASAATGISRETVRKHCNGGSVWLLSNGGRFRWDNGRGLYGTS